MDIHFVTPFAAMGRSVVSLIFESGPFAKFILLVIFGLSVISWAIIYDRIRLYLRLKRGGRMLQEDLASKGLNIPMAKMEKCLPSIEGALLLETQRYLGAGNPARPAADDARKKAWDRGRLKDLLDGRATTEVSEMEKYLIFLATTASVSPFLGLLGTVWGIMSSFLSMGMQGSASIEVVGPGIAEALVTTIAGLGAAITALVGYNLLIRHVRRQESLIELFISRLLALTGVQDTDRRKAASEVTYEEKPV
jgi:biopolymer transport protein TolQ